jgi:putative transposase
MIIFRDDDDRLLFLKLLAEEVSRCNWILQDYSLMGNHYHLAIGTPECTLSKGMHRLLTRYAQRFNRRHGRRGHLFQERFKSVLVEEESHATVLTRYIALNAVRAGFCARPEEWRWSSYAARAGYAPPFAGLSLEPLMSQFGSTREESQRAYREFVLAGIELADDFEPSIAAGLYLGTKAWRERMQGFVDAEEASEEHPLAQMRIGRPCFDDVIEAVSKTFDERAETITKAQNRRSLDRVFVACLAFEDALLTQRQIAQHLEGSTAGAISSLIARGRALFEREPSLRDLLDACRARMRRQPLTSPLPALDHNARGDHRREMRLWGSAFRET